MGIYGYQLLKLQYLKGFIYFLSYVKGVELILCISTSDFLFLPKLSNFLEDYMLSTFECFSEFSFSFIILVFSSS